LVGGHEQLSRHTAAHATGEDIISQALPVIIRARRATPRVSLVDYRKNLEALVEEYRSRNIAPFFIDLPRRKRAGEETTRSSYSEVLQEVGRQLSVPVIDPGDLG